MGFGLLTARGKIIVKHVYCVNRAKTGDIFAYKWLNGQQV